MKEQIWSKGISMENRQNTVEKQEEMKKETRIKKEVITVGIVMAAYNSQNFIKEQLDSILHGEYQNVHIYVRDDGSTDNTVSIVKEYEANYPTKVTLVQNKQNGGLVKNFLTGVIEAEEDYIMFCDHDDVWLPKKVKITLKEMRKAEKEQKNLPVAVFTDAEIVDGQLHSLGASFYERSHFNFNQMDLSYMLMENKLLGCTIIINKALKDKITVLPEHARVHDWWVALIASAFGKIVFVNEKTMLYRQHSSNVIGNRSYGKYVTDAVKSLKKQKEKLILTEEQAKDFYEIYKKDFSKKQRKIVFQFANIGRYSFIKRKRLVLQNQYLKSGWVRNIGVLFII